MFFDPFNSPKEVAKMSAPRRASEGLHPLCGRSCSQEQWTYLVTRLGLVEGHILEILENGDLTLRQLMERLEWEPCAIAMATGSLIRQGFIRSFENGGEVFLQITEVKT